MENKGTLTRVLAIVGSVLVWLPILLPLVFAVSVFVIRGGGRFLFDYLMPAELFPVILVGGGLLLWAAFRAHSRRALIGWGLGGALILLVGGQAIAVVTGLASGETEPAGWQWALVVVSLVGFWVAILVIGAGGILLLRDLFRLPHLPDHSGGAAHHPA